jgi:hypothetical protein
MVGGTGQAFGAAGSWASQNDLWSPKYVAGNTYLVRYQDGRPVYFKPNAAYKEYAPWQGGGNSGGGGSWWTGEAPAATPSSGATINVTSSIEPTEKYSGNTIQKMVNQLRADASSDLSYAQKAFTFPGVSRSTGTQSAAMPGLLSGQNAAQSSGEDFRLNAKAANAAQLLKGEYAKGQDILSGANNAVTKELSQYQYDTGLNQGLISYLMQLLQQV